MEKKLSLQFSIYCSLDLWASMPLGHADGLRLWVSMPNGHADGHRLWVSVPNGHADSLGLCPSMPPKHTVLDQANVAGSDSSFVCASAWWSWAVGFHAPWTCRWSWAVGFHADGLQLRDQGLSP